MHRVLVCDGVSAAGVDLLKIDADVIEAGTLGEDELVHSLPGCHGLLVRSGTKVTARVFSSAPELRVVARAGVGVDNVDLEAATRHGVLVVNSPAGNILAAAEHTIAMLLACARNIPQAHASMRAGNFDRKRFMGRQVTGKTLGIVGIGNIGAQVARRAQGLEMNVLAHDLFTPPAHVRKIGATPVTLDELLAGSDFITVHVPLSQATKGLINLDALRRLPNHAIVVNCARGGIIDEAALLTALNEGTIGGAALDVFENEPEPNPELIAHPLVVATPHLGASTSEAQEAVAIDAARQLIDVLAGRPPHSPVNVPALSPELLAEVSPYLKIADNLGKLARALIRGPLAAINIEASPRAPEDGLPLVTGRLIARALSGTTNQPINDVNAMLVARERGVQISHGIAATDSGYSRHLEVSIRVGESDCGLAGALIEQDLPRILRIDGFSVDVDPVGQFILVWKRNSRRPGFIGTVGSMLAQAGVGITSIQVGREEVEGQGLLVAQIASPLDEEVQRSILAQEDVTRLELVVFD